MRYMSLTALERYLCKKTRKQNKKWSLFYIAYEREVVTC